MNDDLTVFISYRRSDSSADAGRLYDALRRRFGRENLFMDVDSLRPGEDWVDAVEAAVTRSDVLLAIIGPTWADAKDDDGQLRLHNELDRVRLEIEAALRNQKPVIPVLVEGAPMPTSEDLPESLKPLLRRHAIRISHPTFESDLSALVRALRTIEKAKHPKPGAPAATTPTTPTKPTTPTPLAVPPVPPAAQPAPVTQPYVAQPPAPPVQPAYNPPPVPPAYPYQAPAFGYAQPAPRKSTSPVLLGLVGVGLVLIIGFVLMAALHIGPFAVTAISTPTPTVEPTNQPTEQPTEQPTDQPTDQPTAEPTPTDIASGVPSEPPSGAARTPFPSAAFDPIWAIVPSEMSSSCEPTSNFDTPQLFCYVTSGSESLSFWYAPYPDVDSLNAAYDSWLQYRNIVRDIAFCFDDPVPVPCEGGYAANGYDPAGRVAGIVADGGWLYWTHEPARILGTGYVSEASGVPFADLFGYWVDHAGGLNFPSPPPSP
jgi:hypothetical protein